MKGNGKDFSEEDLYSMIYGFYDGIEPYADDTDGSVRLNICVKAYDTLFIWAGLFSSEEQLREKLDSTDGACLAWLDYHPSDGKVVLGVSDPDDRYMYLTLQGSGAPKLTGYLEQYCIEKEGRTGKELALDFIRDGEA